MLGTSILLLHSGGLPTLAEVCSYPFIVGTLILTVVMLYWRSRK